ncbi:MAG TPA: Stp1/IreP family PP2C-type Ser/Thr phosphatase [Candidatus Angelobacter sp.]|jgi:protein phosphatase|nr:Stp1/IreP family PP2C-type Ser/Thr phosphatase [Candidatus Angelobacter sp.]
MTLALEVAGKTDVGCVRTNNEDNFGFDSRHGIFVVCDGMGGQAAGEVASKMGVDILLDYFRNHPSDAAKQSLNGQNGSLGAQSLANAIQLANKTIFEAGQQHNGRNGMGSTIVAALVRGNSLAIANVGDSRIYLVRQGTIQQLTQDHSLVMEQVRRGYITLQQAQQSEMQNIILRALGSEEVVEADIEDLVALPGDVLIMASDGLTRYVPDEDILTIVQGGRGLQQACGELVKRARECGGDDNITCLLVKIVNQPWYQKVVKLFFGGQQWQNSI